VSGQLNGSDLKLIQDIATRNKTDKKQPTQLLLTDIDLSGATIVEAKDGVKSKEGELPAGFFSGAKHLQRASLPGNATSVSKNCFSGCTALVEVTVPTTVSEIGSSAFSDCNALPSISLPEGLKTIGSNAFNDCMSLTQLTVPQNCTHLFFVVMGAPTQHWAHPWTSGKASSDWSQNEEQWPYQVQFEKTKPL
jgi:hypothetical protein